MIGSFKEVSAKDKLYLATKGPAILKRFKEPKEQDRLKRVLEANKYDDLAELLERAIKYI